MDIVLEIFDTFLLDRLYATTLPGSASDIAENTLTKSTATFFSAREVPTTAVLASSQYLHLEPSQYAYMSAWPRDNIWRQALSLYLITWSDCSKESATLKRHALKSPQALRLSRLLCVRFTILSLRL